MKETKDTALSMLSMKDINGNEVLSSLRSRLRQIRPVSIAINVLEDLKRTKKLTIEQWADALTMLLGAELDDITMFYCQKRFTNFEHIFDITNFVNIMDIAPPESFIDPKLNEDLLPQPYRMLAQIVEEDIIDAAWLIITRLHTEILVDSDGKPLCVPRNQPLQNTCVPTYISEKIANVTSINAAPISNLVFLTTLENVFSVYDPTIDRTLHAITLLDIEESSDTNPKCISPWRISSLSDIDDVDATIRLTVFCVIETMEKVEAPPDPKAKKGAVVEPVLTPCTKGYIAVVEVLLDKVSKPGTLSHDCLRVIAKMQFPISDVAFESRLVCGVSVDGLLVSASSDTGCFVYELPSISETKLHFKKLMEITEESEEPQHAVTNTMPLVEPACQLLKYSSADGVNLKAAVLVPIRLPAKTSSSSKKTSSSNGNMQGAGATVTSEFNRTGLVILFDNLKSWELVGLKTKKDNTEDPKVFHNSLIGAWKLPGVVTSYELSVDRTIVALGLDDGSIALWNLLARSMTAVVARHENFVSSLAFCQTNFGNYLISGAFDGTVCFHQIIGPQDTSFSNLSFPGGDAYTSTTLSSCVSTKMVEYRNDLPAAHVSSINLIPGIPIAVIQYWLVSGDSREIIEGVYNVQTGAVLGKFSLYYGISAQGVDFHPLGVDEVYRSYLKEGQQLNNVDPTLSYSKRAKKYEEFPVTYSGVYFNRSIAACSGDRLNVVSQKYSKREPLKSQGIYFSVNVSSGKQVLCAYSLRTILSCLCPGISTLCLRSEELNAEYLYGMLSPSERMDPALTAEKRSLLQSLNDRIDINRGDVNSRRSDNGSKTNTPGISRLTKEKLKELDMSFSQSQSIVTNKMDDAPSIKQLTGSRILETTLLAAKSLEQSSQSSKARRKRLTNRIKEISSIFG